MNTADMKKKYLPFKILFGLVCILLLAGVFAPVLAPHDPNQTNLSQAQIKAGSEYPLGTDALGRCMLSRILYGARVSIFSSLIITAAVFFVGMLTGVISGYFGGFIDIVLNKLITIMQAFPKIILAIAIAGLMGIGIENTIIALCLVEWTDYARMARSFTFRTKQHTYIKAARICGESHAGIICRRIVPNIVFPLIVNASLGIASIIMEIAALSYLGVGVKESTPEWGSMINAGRDYLQTDVRLIVIPGAAIFITAAVFNLFGEKVRDMLK